MTQHCPAVIGQLTLDKIETEAAELARLIQVAEGGARLQTLEDRVGDAEAVLHEEGDDLAIEVARHVARVVADLQHLSAGLELVHARPHLKPAHHATAP